MNLDSKKIPVKFRRIIAVLSLLYALIFGIVFWLGGSAHDAPAINAQHADSGANTNTPAMLVNDRPQNNGLLTPLTSSAVGDHAETRKNTELSPEQKQAVLGEFFKAAEKDMQRARLNLEKAKTDGASSADIQAKAAMLQRMQIALQKMQAKS